MHSDYIVDQEFKDQVFDDTNTKFKDFENCTGGQQRYYDSLLFGENHMY